MAPQQISESSGAVEAPLISTPTQPITGKMELSSARSYLP